LLLHASPQTRQIFIAIELLGDGQAVADLFSFLQIFIFLSTNLKVLSFGKDLGGVLAISELFKICLVPIKLSVAISQNSQRRHKSHKKILNPEFWILSAKTYTL